MRIRTKIEENQTNVQSLSTLPVLLFGLFKVHASKILAWTGQQKVTGQPSHMSPVHMIYKSPCLMITDKIPSLIYVCLWNYSREERQEVCAWVVITKHSAEPSVFVCSVHVSHLSCSRTTTMKTYADAVKYVISTLNTLYAKYNWTGLISSLPNRSLKSGSFSTFTSKNC
jgi:hypothetical protein